MRKELSGIFNWCIEGLKILRSRGHFKQYDFMTEAIDELENENNPSNLFFEEHVEVVSSQFVGIFKSYSIGCQA